MADGYDPKLGIMHESRSDAQAFVLDLMERGRPMVDAAVLRFIAAQTFSGADFTIRDDGVCRLAPQLARQLCHTIDQGIAEGRPRWITDRSDELLHC